MPLKERRWHRGALTQFIGTHEFRWDLVMGMLTVIYVWLAFHEDAALGPEEYALWGLSVIFLAEFAIRCYDSPRRSDYVRTHWLDLITAVPVPGIPGLRILRLLRLLRLGKIGVLVRKWMVRHGWHETALIWPTMTLFWIASALALWLTEHDAPGTNISTFQEAMSAAFLTAATLGFGRHTTPVTQDGQIVAAVIVFFALGLWGFASARLTELWLRAKRDSASADGDLRLLRHELESLRAELREFTKAILERDDLPTRQRSGALPLKEEVETEA